MHRQSSKSLGGAAFDLNQQAGAYANARDLRPRFAELPPFGHGCFVTYDHRTPSGLYVVPAGIYKLRVRLVGAGGGGGAKVGAGGAGGTTSFGGIFSATGGTGGHGGNTGTPAPGTGVGGDINTTGGEGGGGAPAGGTASGGGGGASGTVLGDGGNGGGSAGNQASGGNACIITEPDRAGLIIGASTDGTISGFVQARNLIVPRFPFEFFSGQGFYTGGNAHAYPWDGRGGTGFGTSHKAPSFGGGGASGYRDTSGYSYTAGSGGGIGGGGGGSGQDAGDLTCAVGRGGDGGGFALKTIDVTPGQTVAFTLALAARAVRAGSQAAGAVAD